METVGIPVMVEEDRRLTGHWRKDTHLSDSMEYAMEITQQSWIIRKAAAILTHLQLEVKGDTLKIVIKAGGILDMVELHPLDGREAEVKRRDLRRGKTLTRASRTPEGLLCLQMSWSDPVAGWAIEVFEMTSDGNTLTMHDTIHVSSTNQTASYKSVYHRM